MWRTLLCSSHHSLLLWLCYGNCDRACEIGGMNVVEDAKNRNITFPMGREPQLIPKACIAWI